MKADALSLAAALNSSEVDVYTIPQYQRPYTWTSEDFDTLWEDLGEASREWEVARKMGNKPEYYFLGPVVFVRNSIKRSYDIIDGQQRTTTFHIMLWYLYRKLTDDTEKARIHQILTFLGKDTKLKVSAKDAATFLKIRQSEEKIEGTSKMTDCANYFRIKIAELQEPNFFSEFLREFTQFIVIVADDYGKAWDLFIGLNGKGQPLNPTDLVKAFVCGRSDVGDTAGAIWEEKILPLKEDSTSYLLFLVRYKARKFISENSLFKEVTKLFPTEISTLDISHYSEVFHWFWHVSIEAIPKLFADNLSFSLEAKKALRVLRELDRRDFTTLLFQYAEAFGIKSIFDERFLQMMASYQIRMAISRKRSRERKFSAWFAEIDFVSQALPEDNRTNDKRLNDDKEAALQLISKTLRSDAPDDDTFQKLVQISSYHGNKPARIILRHNEEGERGNKVISDFHLEHLMPQTGTDYWHTMANVLDEAGNLDSDKYNTIINNIGNLFVIDPSTNFDAYNYEYLTKKNLYQEHLKDWSVARITSSKEYWKPEDIVTRAEEIAKWATHYWKL